MAVPDGVLFPALGFLVGAYGTIIGAGGGFLFVPLLLQVWHLPHTIAIGTSLCAVSLNAISGTGVYARQGRIDYRSAVLFLIAGIPGAVAGAWVPEQLSGRTINLIFGALLGLLAVALILNPERRRVVVPAGEPGSSPADPAAPAAGTMPRSWCTRNLVDAHGIRYEWSFNERAGMGLSAVLGFLSSLLGIGGGIIHVPAMTYYFHFPAHVATATSQTILAATALFGAATHAGLGHVAWGPGLMLGAGAFLGAQVGGRLATRISGRWVIRGLALGLLLLAARLLTTGGRG